MVFAIQDQNVRNKESAFRHLRLNIERVISKLSRDLPCDWVKISTNKNEDKLAYFAREFLARVSEGNSSFSYLIFLSSFRRPGSH